MSNSFPLSHQIVEAQGPTIGTATLQSLRGKNKREETLIKVMVRSIKFSHRPLQVHVNILSSIGFHSFSTPVHLVCTLHEMLLPSLIPIGYVLPHCSTPVILLVSLVGCPSSATTFPCSYWILAIRPPSSVPYLTLCSVPRFCHCPWTPFKIR